MAEGFRVVRQGPFLELRSGAVGIEGHFLSLICGYAARIVMSGATGQPSLALAEAIEVNKRYILPFKQTHKICMRFPSRPCAIRFHPCQLIGSVCNAVAFHDFLTFAGAAKAD